MHTYFVKKAGKSYDVDFASFTPEVQASILHAGLGRIINDLVAAKGTQSEHRAAVEKKLAAWASGEVRTATARTSDPVARRALELAANAVKGSKGFIAWIQTNGFKLGSKEAVKMAADKAKELCAVEDNKYVVQARIDVEAAKALGDDELEIEI